MAVTNPTSFLDKDWIVCDSTPTSPFYGNCYIEYDNNSAGNQIQMLTSTDGGITWSGPRVTADTAHGLGGQPLVQPNGTVVVPYLADGSAQIRSFVSTAGGSSWGSSVLISSETTHGVGGGMRTSPLPSADVDGAGKVYVAWQDCRFRNGCPANDLVFATSTNGTTWSAVQRVPIDAATSTVDHFIPGLTIDASTSGTSAHLALYYYYFPNSNCTASNCALDVGFVSSSDGGATWSPGQQIAGPMTVNQVAATTQGPMVGDYISASFLNGRAYGVFAIGGPPSGATYNEAMYTVTGGLRATGGSRRSDTWTGPLNSTPSRPSRASTTAY
ncbi:MAG: glycoside hydrolase [Actinomycetota bacterium]|nr:glycoside hydrolase [Actinomycetota bacterium]